MFVLLCPLVVSACSASTATPNPPATVPDEAYGPAASAPPVTALLLPGPLAQSPYLPVNEPDFKTTMEKMSAAKAGLMAEQAALLAERYDLSDKPQPGVTMTRGKAVQGASA